MVRRNKITVGIRVNRSSHTPLGAIRELKQRRRRRRRQRERHKTMGLISKNNSSARAFYVLYISLPSPAKQQREMTKFKVLWRT